MSQDSQGDYSALSEELTQAVANNRAVWHFWFPRIEAEGKGHKPSGNCLDGQDDLGGGGVPPVKIAEGLAPFG